MQHIFLRDSYICIIGNFSDFLMRADVYTDFLLAVL